MAEPKAKTLQQKLGFFDEDLKSPVHDDILKWLDENLEEFIYENYNLREWHPTRVEQQKRLAEETFKKNILKAQSAIDALNIEMANITNELPELQKEYLKKLIRDEETNYQFQYSEFALEKIQQREKRVNEIESEITELKSRITTLKEWKGLGQLPERKKIKIIENPWEFPVTSQSSISGTGYRSSKSIIGFIDLKVKFEYTQLSITGIDFYSNKIIGDVDWTQTKRKNIEDIEDTSLCEFTFYVEVKTKIASLGELFRQLRMYQEYISGDFIIVCPNDSEKEMIKKQGFRFYKYDPQRHSNL